jgi:hypothetical protein
MNGVTGYDERAFLATAQNAAKLADYFGQWKILMLFMKSRAGTFLNSGGLPIQ